VPCAAQLHRTRHGRDHPDVLAARLWRVELFFQVRPTGLAQRLRNDNSVMKIDETRYVKDTAQGSVTIYAHTKLDRNFSRTAPDRD
jgi:hypothetical protein